ncbi:MAG TPA: hypothetical protein VK813_05340 [Edaphobacter sp.]|nr:hypothetical protein [Edaphobacter sp.]
MPLVRVWMTLRMVEDCEIAFEIGGLENHLFGEFVIASEAYH